ncbi:MAG: TRAP transporter small permease [Lawsonibacter sp.]|jgi:TRAP-type C4-dicarboxylate transport system permease small subunit
MKKLLWILDHFEELAASILLGITFVSFGLQIFFRLFGIPGAKISEVYQYSFLVALMFGISYANRHDEHIRADILTSRVGPKTKFVMEILGDIATIVFSMGLVYYGMKVVNTMIQYPQNLPLLNIPYWVIYIILPITSVTAIIRVIQNRVSKIREKRNNTQNDTLVSLSHSSRRSLYSDPRLLCQSDFRRRRRPYGSLRTIDRVWYGKRVGR